jgi:hypothetical protein
VAALAGERGERDRERGPGRRREEVAGVSGARDRDLAERGPEAVRRHAGDAEDRDALDAPGGGDQVGRVGEVGREERATDDEVERRERVQRRAGPVEEEEEGIGCDVRDPAPEEDAPAPEPVEQRPDRRPHADAHGETGAEHEPDGHLASAEGAHEERKEEEHPEAHPAREVDRAREPERGRVERAGGVHACGQGGV